MAVLKDKLAKEKADALASRQVLGEEFPEALRRRLHAMAGGQEKLNALVLQLLGDYAEKFDRLALQAAVDDHQLQSRLGSEMNGIRNELRDLQTRVPDDLDSRLARLEDRLLEQHNLLAETHKIVALLLAGDEGNP